MNKSCAACRQCKETVVSLAGVAREVALVRYLQLQMQGHAPAMCEDASGRCNVCFNASHRLDAEFAIWGRAA